MFIVLGRDHGLPTFLDARRKCGFNANFQTFDDLIAIFPQNYVDLLKTAYSSVEDIDLYVGGSLESFLVMESVFLGETFGCVIGEQYRRTMGGDSYFYSNPNSPYPFTPAQLGAIKSMNFQNLICVNSGLSLIQKVWFLVDNQSYNTKIPCTIFKQMDFSAWEEVEPTCDT
jgi:peroxidase